MILNIVIAIIFLFLGMLIGYKVCLNSAVKRTERIIDSLTAEYQEMADLMTPKRRGE